MSEAQAKSFCCSSKRSLCYWAAVFAIFYAIGLTLVFLFHGISYEVAVLFAALGLACVVNFARNRTFHCIITGPFFFLIAIAFSFRAAGIWNVSTGALWITIGIVVCASFLLERKFAS